MEGQDRRDTPPLWLQLPASATMLRQRPSAFPIFENSITLVVLVPLLLLLVISFVLSFVSHTSQIFRNNMVKNGWDLLNVVLVLFPILCGVVGKLYNDETEVIEHEVVAHTSSVSEQMTTNISESSSFAIFDEFDFMINNPRESQIVHSGLNEVGSDDCNIKVISVDTCVIRPAQSSAKAPPLPSNPPKSRARRSLESDSPAKKQHEFVNIQTATLLRPPPLVTPEHQPHEINNTNIAKKSGAGKEIATAIASLYKHTKRKTKHMTTNKNQKNTLPPPTKPPPPPPPLPPPSVFHNMFRKATRTRRIHSEASASPPRSSSLGVKTKLFDSKPPLPKKMQSNCKKNVDVGSNKSAEFPVPPRMNMFEHPEIGNVDLWSTMGSHDAREGSQLEGSVLCPSPDVNVKADRFIARLRGEWKSDILVDS